MLDANSVLKSATRRWLRTAKHLQPRSKGAAIATPNIRTASLFCNQTRHRIKQVLDPGAYRANVRHRTAKGKWYPR